MLYHRQNKWESKVWTFDIIVEIRGQDELGVFRKARKDDI